MTDKPKESGRSFYVAARQYTLIRFDWVKRGVTFAGKIEISRTAYRS